MAGYGKAGATLRIVSLIIIIFLLAFGVAPLLFRLLGIPTLENSALAWVTRPFGMSSASGAPRANSGDLLEQERLERLQVSLERRDFEIQQREERLASADEELKAREEVLIAQERELEDRAEILSIRMQSFDNLDANLLTNAQYLNGMPPAAAVAILENIADDQVLIDHLRAADRFAAAQGSASLSSVWISMMNPERAGRIVAKMATPQ
jgi:flagellar protein FlbB